MPVTQDRLTRLREFGLSEYAARSYLALLDLGIAEARDVSSLSKVPQAKIYHVLEQLHEKGLVVILPEFPKKYAPVPFEEYLTRLYDEHTKAARSIQDQRNELAELFRVVGDTDVGDRGFFTVIRGRRNVLAKVDEIMAQTKEDLLVLGTAGTASRAASMVGELKQARSRGVRVRLMAPVDAETVGLLPPLAELSDLRAREVGENEHSGKVAIVVSDAARAFLIHFVPDDGNLYAGKDIGVFTDQEAMVAAIQALVEPEWSRAAPYERRREDLALGRAPEFTRIYAPQQAKEAIDASLKADVKDVNALNGFHEHARGSRARWRCVLDVGDTPSANELAREARSNDHLEVRHLRTPLVSRQLVIDGREAYFTLGGASPDGSDVVIHTNAPQVMRALRTQFDSFWALSSTLDERLRELEIFPGLQPGDVGVGRLFHLLRDAIVVADSTGKVLLWNPAAQQMFGRKQVSGVTLASLFSPRARDDLRERIAKVEGNTAGEEVSSFETAAQRTSGEFPVETTLSLLRGVEGTPYVVLVMRDITARRRAAEAEREINARVRRAYERMNEAFYALDRSFRFIYRNPVVRAMQKTVPDDKIDGHVIWEAFPDLVGTKFETELKRAAQEQKPVKFEEHYPRLDMWFEVSAYPSDEGLSVYFRNITERKLHEAEQRRAASLLTATLESTTDGILVISTDGKITGHNRKMIDMWRLPPEVMVAGTDARAVDFARSQLVDPEAFERRIEEVYASPEAESFDVLRLKDGRVFERYSMPQRVGDTVVGRVWSFRDVTKRLHAESRVRAAEERLREVVEHSTNLFYAHTAEHVLTYVSPHTRQFFDCDPEEALVRWTEFMSDHPANAEGVKATQRAIATGERQPPYELELVGKKGRRIWVEVNEAPVVRDGKTVMVVGALTDITARKEAQAALGRSEERFERVFMDAPMPMAIADSAGKLVQVNSALCTILGHAREDLVGKELLALLPKPHRVAFREETKQLFAGARLTLTTAVDLLATSGKSVPVKAHVSVVHGPDERPKEILVHVYEYPPELLRGLKDRS